MTDHFDDLVIGAGMAGLTVAALLAKAGRKVLVVEAHDVPGGYAHTFTLKNYRFCAQVHYIFSCAEGESVHTLLRELGAEDRVPFLRLDPDGFDHVVVAGERIRIPNGLAKYEERLTRLYPQWSKPLRRYFETVAAIGRELAQDSDLPSRLTPWSVLTNLVRYRHTARHARWTLDDFYDHVSMPPRLRAILAGQSGDYLLPPRDVSFLLHVALVCGYDRGAYYPKHHFFHFVETIADAIRSAPGCAILLEHEVDRIHVEGGRVTGISTTNGRRFTASRYVSNVDPQQTAKLAGEHHFGRDRKKLRYDYSCATFNMYLGVRGMDLRDHGFGSFNVWHYPHEDLNRMYDDQLVRHDLSNPWLFLSTPTLHSPEPGLCPPGDQILEVATACDHDRFAALRKKDRRAYNAEKKKIRENLLDLLEASYLPGLRDHLVMRVTGTGATSARFCRAPAGNAYGAALTPANIGVHRRPFKTALDNLWMVNATAGLPSVAGTIGAGLRLHRELDERA